MHDWVQGACVDLYETVSTNKPTKWCLKAWVLAEADTGFVFNWKLYTGKETEQTGVNMGQRVVLDLIMALSQGHEVYFDNFFTCYEILQALYARGIARCGTVNLSQTEF